MLSDNSSALPVGIGQKWSLVWALLGLSTHESGTAWSLRSSLVDLRRLVMTAQMWASPDIEFPGASGERDDPAGSERRMREIFTANVRPLRRFLLRQTHGQAEAADDLLQETMLRAWRKVDELPQNAESIRRWLFTVARNLAIDAARARQSRPVEVCGEDISWVGAIEETYDGLLDRVALRDVLLQLTSEHRAVLVALYYRDATVAETAERIGIPEGTVRSRSFYALRTVREIIDRDISL
jgi:RNA polymerase sigma-70 factor (ECF subfamily)